ncbi:GAL3ST1 [Branchiostoma lanceolatum]|uniref:GAL3ST1 protein n=1 Tax=Branchiostoma lanceolatum TaxID=7740 RepID=A0A8K0EE79_BRALA|nr:GAL3ST1 [Branchiostoma lanceolatum]
MEVRGLRTIKTCLAVLILLSLTACILLQYVGLESGTIWRQLRKGRKEIYSSMTHVQEQSDFSERSPDANGSIACTPHDNVAFIKVYKCGSSTLQSFFLRYAHQHDLIPALPRRGDFPSIGCGAVIKENNVLQLPGSPKWNIFAHHFIFNKTVFDRFMPSDTRFVAILRNPIARLNSVFDYFKMWKFFKNMTETGPGGQSAIMTYLQDPSGWDKVFVGRNRRCYAGRCVRNCMATDLGYNSLDTATEFVSKVDKQFSTILILEHLNHSLVLLKRKMCWSLNDIIYDVGRRQRERKGNTSLPITNEMKARYRKSSPVDHALYDHFNRSLWQQIRLEGSDFLEELSHFQQVLDDIFVFCHEQKEKGRQMIIPASRWNEPITMSGHTCYLLTWQRTNWDMIIRRRLLKRFGIKKG